MINVKCSAPKYAKGEHQFTHFEEFAHWLVQIKGGRVGIGSRLCALAEKGTLNVGTTRYCVEATSDFFIKDYFVGKELVRRTGVMETELGRDVYSHDLEAAMTFARGVDQLAKLGGYP